MQKMNKKKILAIVRDTKDIKQEANDWIDALVDLGKCAIFKRVQKFAHLNNPYMSEELRLLKYHLTEIDNLRTVGEEIEELMDCINKLRNGYPLPSLVLQNENEWREPRAETIYEFTKKKLDK